MTNIIIPNSFLDSLSEAIAGNDTSIIIISSKAEQESLITYIFDKAKKISILSKDYSFLNLFFIEEGDEPVINFQQLSSKDDSFLEIIVEKSDYNYLEKYNNNTAFLSFLDSNKIVVRKKNEELSVLPDCPSFILAEDLNLVYILPQEGDLISYCTIKKKELLNTTKKLFDGFKYFSTIDDLGSHTNDL